MGRYVDVSAFVRMTGAEESEALDLQIAAAEDLTDQYLGRTLEYGADTDVICPDDPRAVLLLKAYPVAAIADISDEIGMVTDYRADLEAGIVRLARPTRGDITINYTGGCATIPGAVKYAVVLLAQALISAGEYGGTNIMSERLDDYQIMYYNKENASASVPALSRAAAALLAPYRGRSL